MKILVSAPYYHPKTGGLETYARQLALALQQLGNEVVIVTSNHLASMHADESVDGMRIFRLRRWFKLSNTPVNPLWFLAIRRIIKAENPDIILTHSPVPTMADATLLAAGKRPTILFYHAASLLKKNAPVFNTVARMYGLYQSLSFKRANTIAAVSDYVVSSLPAKYRSKAVVVPNAVWGGEVITSGVTASANTFAFIASLDRTHSWKGLDEILEAVAISKRSGKTALLNVIGDGDHRAHYEQKAGNLGIASEVTFHGALHGEAKNNIIRNSRALICYPTSSNDAFPTVMLEAWSQRTLVVAAKIGPLPSLVLDGVDGLLIDANDPTALADGLQTVMALPTRRLNAMLAAANEKVSREFTWETQAARVQSLIKELA